MDAPPTLHDDLANLMRNVKNYQEKIPDVDAYVASIDIPETVEGPVGGSEQPELRHVQRNSPQGQAIVAAQLKREREAELQAMETEPVSEAAAPVQALANWSPEGFSGPEPHSVAGHGGGLGRQQGVSAV